ncbi:hypothetical protein ACFFXD_004159 [Salmonella enterica]
MYSELFTCIGKRLFKKSMFVFIDFNGEYKPIHNQLNDKSNYIVLDTHLKNGNQKLKNQNFGMWNYFQSCFQPQKKPKSHFLTSL